MPLPTTFRWVALGQGHCQAFPQVSASCDGTVKVWPLSARDAPRQCLELRGHSDAVWSVDPRPEPGEGGIREIAVIVLVCDDGMGLAQTYNVGSNVARICTLPPGLGIRGV
jgi:hypothetical protein